MPKYCFEFEQNSSAWHYARAGKVTASEMHRIITPKTGKLSTQADKYMYRLLAEWALGKPLSDDDYTSPWMEEGHDNEQATVDSFEFQTGRKTRTVGFVERGDGLVGCSPDRLIVDDTDSPCGTLEVKSPTAPIHMAYLLESGSLSEAYRTQVQAQLWICELEFGYVFSNCRPLPPIEPIRIERDNAYIASMAVGVDQFLERMLKHRESYVKSFGQPPAMKTIAHQDKSDKIFLGTELSLDDITF